MRGISIASDLIKMQRIRGNSIRIAALGRRNAAGKIEDPSNGKTERN
jgi:hypothetical protein